MDIVKKIEKQTEKFLELRQKIEGIVEALNEFPVWEQSIDDAKAKAKKLQRRFELLRKVYNFSGLLTDDQLQEAFEENKEVLDELEEIKNYLRLQLVGLHMTFNNNKP